MAVALKKSFPECEITWVVDKRFRGVVECCSAIDHVVERPASPLEAREWSPFDAALDMQGLLKSAVIVGAAKAKQKLGYHWQREGARLFSRPVLPDPTSIHIVDQYADVARALGADADRADFGLTPMPEDLEVVSTKLKSKGIGHKSLVLFNAGAGWATKRWDPKNYAQVSDQLVESGSATAFLGAPTDRDGFQEVLAHCRHTPIDMIGETNVRELVALVSLAKVHVGGDTGSTHLAAALGVPAVGVYTLTRPERSCPYGQFENCFDASVLPQSVAERVQSLLQQA